MGVLAAKARPLSVHTCVDVCVDVVVWKRHGDRLAPLVRAADISPKRLHKNMPRLYMIVTH